MSKIYEIYGTDAHKMSKRLMEEADVADHVKQGSSVVLKPNLVNASSAENGATTHPEVLSGCIEYLQEKGFSDISIIESSWVGETTGRAMRACGYDRICEKYGIPFYDLKKDKVRRVKTPLRPMDISERALDADFFIDIPVLKGHCQTRMTCALKNLKGCIPDHEKRQFHAEGLIKPIAALASAIKPDLVIVDSICGDLYFEDGGNPVQTNRMMLGFDAVQMDAYGCSLMGLDVKDVAYIGLAKLWGVGLASADESEIIRINKPESSMEYPPVTGKVKELTKNVEADGACSACFASFVRALYLAQKEGIPVKDKIFIGQGHQGRDLSGIGIGRCCKGSDRCTMGCPPTADKILESFKG